MPVSALLALDEVMMTLNPIEHGSTYGGNPLACKVAMVALEVLSDENMSAISVKRGEQLRVVSCMILSLRKSVEVVS